MRRFMTVLAFVVLVAACATTPRAPVTPDDGQLGPAMTTARPTTTPPGVVPTGSQEASEPTGGPAGGDSTSSGDEPSEEPGDGGPLDGGEVEAPVVTPPPS